MVAPARSTSRFALGRSAPAARVVGGVYLETNSEPETKVPLAHVAVANRRRAALCD